MGIDRIAGRSIGVPGPETGAASGAVFRRTPFEVGPSAASRAEQPTQPAAAPDAARPVEGDLSAYVARKVDEATSHLSALPPSELEAIREALHDRIANDPSLVDLVRTASGLSPVQHEE